MTEQSIPVEEMKAAEGETFTDTISVRGDQLVKTVQALLREAAVRKITVIDKNGRTLVEFPLYAGIIGAFVIGSWTVLALIAAWFAEVSILIERDLESDSDEPTVLGEAAERAMSGVSSTVSSTGENLTILVGDLARNASDLVRRAADSIEARMVELTPDAEPEAPAPAKAAPVVETAVEPQQCVALTKSGARCKRTALAGSDYCSTHQPLAN